MEKNRKSYDNPLIELLLFSDADVITTSGETGGGDSGGDYNGDRDWTGEWDPID